MGKDRIYFSYLNFWKTDYSEPNKVFLLLSILAISRTEFNLMRYHMFPPVPLDDRHVQVQLFHIQTENRTEKRKSFPFLQILLILKMPLLMTMAVISQKNFKNLGGACPCTCMSSTAHAIRMASSPCRSSWTPSRVTSESWIKGILVSCGSCLGRWGPSTLQEWQRERKHQSIPNSST